MTLATEKLDEHTTIAAFCGTEQQVGCLAWWEAGGGGREKSANDGARPAIAANSQHPTDTDTANDEAVRKRKSTKRATQPCPHVDSSIAADCRCGTRTGDADVRDGTI